MSGDVNSRSVWMLIICFSFMSNLHVTGDHRIPAYTFRIPERQEHRIPAYTARIPNQRGPLYQAVCKEVSTYTKKDSPIYQPYTKRIQKENFPYTKRIPSTGDRQERPYTNRIPTCGLSSSLSFCTFCRIWQQLKTKWFRSHGLQSHLVWGSKWFAFELRTCSFGADDPLLIKFADCFLKSENYKNVTSK